MAVMTLRFRPAAAVVAALCLLLVPACAGGDGTDVGAETSSDAADSVTESNSATEATSAAEPATAASGQNLPGPSEVPDLASPITLEDVEDQFGVTEPAGSTTAITAVQACDRLPIEAVSEMAGGDTVATTFGGCTLLTLSEGRDLNLAVHEVASLSDVDDLGLPDPAEDIVLSVAGRSESGRLHRFAHSASGPAVVFEDGTRTWVLTQTVNTSAGGSPLAPNQMVEVARLLLASVGTARDTALPDTAPSAADETDIPAPDAAAITDLIIAWRATQNLVVDRQAPVEDLRPFLTAAEWERFPDSFANVQIRRESSGLTMEPGPSGTVIARDCLFEYYSALTPDEPSSVVEEVFTLATDGDEWRIAARRFGRPDCPQLDE